MESAMIAKNSIIKVSKDQVSCDMGGEAAILEPNSGMYYGLNLVGSRVWSLIQEPKTVSDVLHVLVDEYDVEASCCERDLLLLLQQLAERGLIEINETTK